MDTAKDVCSCECCGRDNWNTYLGLVAEAIVTVNPDVLGENLSFLVQFHILGQIGRVGDVNVIF